MRIAFVTDVHIGPDALYRGKLRKLSHQAEPLLEAFVDRMNSVAKPDLVVNLGDAIEDVDVPADREHYGKLVRICAGLDAPVIHVAGNHDLVHLSEADLLELHGRTGRLFFSRDLGAVQALVLCSWETKDQGVVLPEEQIGWLTEELERLPGPVLVFVHHPLCEMRLDTNRWFFEAPHLCRVANRRRVRQLFEDSGKVIGVFNGHAHWHYCSVIGGIPYVTLQSLIENVEDDAPGRAASAHALLDLSPKRLTFEAFGEHPVRYQFDRAGPRGPNA